MAAAKSERATGMSLMWLQFKLLLKKNIVVQARAFSRLRA